MNTKVTDLLVTSLFTGSPHQTLGHAKKLMAKHNIHAIPIVNDGGEPVGILTSSDLIKEENDATPLSKVMTRKVYTVPQYSDAHLPARIMRNKQTHHVIVTHEKKIVGILSSFDLLKLVEDHRFVMKGALTENRRRGPRGKKEYTNGDVSHG